MSILEALKVIAATNEEKTTTEILQEAIDKDELHSAFEVLIKTVRLGNNKVKVEKNEKT